MCIKILVLLIKIYQIVLSPFVGKQCRFYPSCSNYAIDALRTHGMYCGIKLIFQRLIRCRPFGESGYDPVPPNDKS